MSSYRGSYGVRLGCALLDESAAGSPRPFDPTYKRHGPAASRCDGRTIDTNRPWNACRCIPCESYRKRRIRPFRKRGEVALAAGLPKAVSILRTRRGCIFVGEVLVRLECGAEVVRDPPAV
jgi:hypothetical protein